MEETRAKKINTSLFEVVNAHSDAVQREEERNTIAMLENRVHTLSNKLNKVGVEKEKYEKFYNSINMLIRFFVLMIVIWVVISFIDVNLHNTAEGQIELMSRYNFFRLVAGL